MGDYLQDAYAERDLAKALAKAHGIIDEETRKLSDKVKNLTLSHNRMRTLLKMSKAYIELSVAGLTGFETAQSLHKRLTLELYGLENYKGLKGGK